MFKATVGVALLQSGVALRTQGNPLEVELAEFSNGKMPMLEENIAQMLETFSNEMPMLKKNMLELSTDPMVKNMLEQANGGDMVGAFEKFLGGSEAIKLVLDDVKNVIDESGIAALDENQMIEKFANDAMVKDAFKQLADIDAADIEKVKEAIHSIFGESSVMDALIDKIIGHLKGNDPATVIKSALEDKEWLQLYESMVANGDVEKMMESMKALFASVDVAGVLQNMLEPVDAELEDIEDRVYEVDENGDKVD